MILLAQFLKERMSYTNNPVAQQVREIDQKLNGCFAAAFDSRDDFYHFMRYDCEMDLKDPYFNSLLCHDLLRQLGQKESQQVSCKIYTLKFYI